MEEKVILDVGETPFKVTLSKENLKELRVLWANTLMTKVLGTTSKYEIMNQRRSKNPITMGARGKLEIVYM